MTRWEYRTIKVEVGGFFGGKIEESEVDEILNSAGRDSWELVGAESVETQGTTSSVLFMFKRPSH